jgi:glucose-6-phosphate dehydrogenase assembly protein OpcA
MDVGRIEADLERLRHEAAGGSAEGEVFALRTNLLNLIVHAPNAEAARMAAQTISAMPGRHPSRTLITVAGPAEANPKIEADLAAHCHVRGELEPQVCCEEVTLTVEGRAADHMHSVIAPLLVSDLPVYVWWIGDLPDDPHTLRETLDGADRLVVDSEEFAQTDAGLRRLVSLCGEPQACAIGDLAWGRLAPWREILAQHCETPDFEPFLRCVEGVELQLAGGSEQGSEPSQMLLMLGWLAARFGWDAEGALKSDSGLTMPSAAGGATVSVGESATEGLEPGWLVELRLLCAGDEGAASVAIERTGDPRHLTVRIQHPETVADRRVRIEACGEAEMLARELDASGHDSEYDRALAGALAIAQALA